MFVNEIKDKSILVYVTPEIAKGVSHRFCRSQIIFSIRGYRKPIDILQSSLWGALLFAWLLFFGPSVCIGLGRLGLRPVKARIIEISLCLSFIRRP
jgi:hypothetical protein